MKKPLFLIAFFIIILFSLVFVKEILAKSDETRYLGTWVRQATYVSGALMGQDPAVMTLKKDSFTSTNATCATAGTLSVSGNTMKMVMTQSNCLGVKTPYTVNYTYTISDDGKIMTFVVGSMKEVYKRR